MTQSKKFKGVIPSMYNISEQEIIDFIEQWRSLNPNEKRSNDELRPYVVNTIKNKKQNELHNTSKS